MDKLPCMDFLLILSFCLIICSEISQQTILKIETSNIKGKKIQTPSDDPVIIAIISRNENDDNTIRESSGNESTEITIISAKNAAKNEDELTGNEDKTSVTTKEQDLEKEVEEDYNQMETIQESQSIVMTDNKTVRLLSEEIEVRKKLVVAAMTSSLMMIFILLAVLFCVVSQQPKNNGRISSTEDPDRQFFILPAEKISPLLDSFRSSSNSSIESAETSLLSERPRRTSFDAQEEGNGLRGSPVGPPSRDYFETSTNSSTKTHSPECKTVLIPPRKPSERILQIPPQEPSQNHKPQRHSIRFRKTSMVASLASVVSAQKKWSCVPCLN
ncbi:uncharacterized protein LOC115094572 isoform X2 [Rhinatrema bivittatum]|uniref:uncharacterized protein LOC115094572 isoform X2 n=1 Tax=Rhinatrema bivittatum TaxID=194408 RepID=UPI00112C9B84|nr:uncharacterized protein LOC115094572 isoform X2 [Rhinatrema bivittatum]